MLMAKILSEEEFAELLRAKLGDDYERALQVFRDFGRRLSPNTVNALMWATKKGKVGEVLGEMEQHFETTLSYQHPDIRGMIFNANDTNSTELFFYHLYQDVLELQP